MLVSRLQIAELVRPIRNWMPRGYGYVYKKLLGNYHNYERDSELRDILDNRHRVFYDRFLQANVYVDIADWACRGHYYIGSYYDRIVPLLTDRLLANGGTFIDIGANRGLHALYAAKVLAGKGLVYAFEPHPVTFDVLKAHLTINSIKYCFPFNIGVSKEKGTLKLNMFDHQHSGACSFVDSGEIHESVSVPVQTLDDALAGKSLLGPLLIKIDVEGYEYNVLQGMEKLLKRPDVSIICEITDTWLVKAGASADALFEFLRVRGYSAHLPEIRYSSLIKEDLKLTTLKDLPQERQYDVVFMRT